MTTLQLSPPEAAKELLRRRRIRANLTEWARHCGFEPARHHRLLIDKLEAVARGEIKRLIVFMPPGSAKSTYVSLLFAIWWMARNPGRHILASSYSAELAERWSRKVRALAEEHGPTLGVSLSPDMQTVAHWALSSGSEYRAAGVGGSITGFRAWLGLIDDAVKNREEADSETMRERTWDWFVADYETRLVPDAPLIVIGTRWHEDDLYGRILKRANEIGEHWDVVKLPAVATNNDPLGRAPGEPLWPEWQSQEALQLERARKGLREWSALYQQEPTPDGGLYFEREWLVLADPPPRSEMRILGSSDYAVTEGGGDYTVHWVAGMDAQGRLHLLDLYHRQATADDWVDAFKSMVLTWKPVAWGEEEATILKSVGPFLERRMKEQPRAFVRRVGFKPVADKPTRARTLQAMMADNKIVVAPDKPWLADFVAEMMSFPAGKHDDMIDALAILAQLAQEQARPVNTQRPRSYASGGDILGG
ncbi:MAG: phage terminase large subunit [Hyphomonadaceae bacterium]